MTASKWRVFRGCRARIADPAAFLRVVGVAALLAPQAAGAVPISPEGRWLTEDGGGVVSIAPCGAALCGHIIGLSEWPKNGDVKRDVQGTPQCHMVLLDNLKLQDDSRWHGTVRNPEDGRVYSAEVWIGPDGAMRLRGYVGLPIFGSTQIWPAFHGAVKADCHFK